jgi:iron complex outermembrane receptor protein
MCYQVVALFGVFGTIQEIKLRVSVMDMLRMVCTYYKCSLLVISCLLVSAASLAESVDKANTSSENTVKSRVIEEVIVTATKRATSVRDIPISIDALSASEMESRGVNNMEEMIKYSVGVTFQKGTDPGKNAITMRGIGAEPSNAFGSTFGLFYGDIPLVNPTIVGMKPDFTAHDLARVEILKGPQGTLFGGQALAGAVRYIPNSPEYDESYGNVEFGRGKIAESNDASESFGAMINIGASRMALRLAADKQRNAGYIDDLLNNEDDVNRSVVSQGRAILAINPIDALNVELTYLKRTVDASGNNQTDNGENYSTHDKEIKEFAEFDVELQIIDMSWSWFDTFDITAISSNLHKMAITQRDGSPNAATEIPLTDISSTQKEFQDTEQITHEFRLTSKERSTSDWWIAKDWDFLIGFFYLNSDQNLYIDLPIAQFNPIPGGIIPVGDSTGSSSTSVLGEFDATAKEKALFFEMTRYLFDDQVELILAGRKFEQVTKAAVYADAAFQTDPLNTQATRITNISGEMEEDGFNPKVALTWHINDDARLIMSAAEGFRFGGLNSDAFMSGEPPFFYKSDAIKNYEVGFRTDWLDGRLQIDATAFLIKWEDTQQSLITNSPIRATPYIDNVGAAEVKGGEFSGKTVLPFNLSLNMNLGYSDAKFVEEFDSPRGRVEKGAALPISPRWTASTVVSHFTRLATWDVRSSLSYAYQGERQNDLFNTYPLKEFHTLATAITFSNELLPMKPLLRLSVTNLENRKVITFAKTENNPFRGFTFLTPRTISLNVKLAF